MTYLLTRASTTRNRFCRGLAALVCFASLATVAHAGHLYRYKNSEGFWVISSAIPSDRVALGYRVIDENGQVIEEVAPQLSPAESRAFLARLEEERKRDDAIRRINLLYGSETDIEHALQKALRSIDTSIANTQAIIAHLQVQRQT